MRNYPDLRAPPIDEVVCGVAFEMMPDLDPLTLGVYWGTRAADYPQRSLMPAIFDQPRFQIGAVQMRAMLISADDQFVIQLQADRFYMNWRERGLGYPRFSERHGPNGLLRRALQEFGQFNAFVEERFGRKLAVQSIDLTKIDMIRKGRHWDTLSDLAKILPVTETLGNITGSENRQSDLRFFENGSGGNLAVQIQTVSTPLGPEAARLDFKFSHSTRDPRLTSAFESANDSLNAAFFRVVSASELHRFGLQS